MEAVVKELSNLPKSAKAEKRDEPAINCETKYDAVERLVSVSRRQYTVHSSGIARNLMKMGGGVLLGAQVPR